MLKRPAGANADEWHLFLSENKDALPFVAVQIAEAIEALERQVFVPGLWRCPKCEFQLCQATLYAATGTVGARDDPGDKCPNCNSPLWRVTERAAGNEMVKRCEQLLEDSARLNWLDEVNQRTNDRNGTRYGWRFDINHNRAALTDHNRPVLTVREAIDDAKHKM